MTHPALGAEMMQDFYRIDCVRWCVPGQGLLERLAREEPIPHQQPLEQKLADKSAMVHEEGLEEARCAILPAACADGRRKVVRECSARKAAFSATVEVDIARDPQAQLDDGLRLQRRDDERRLRFGCNRPIVEVDAE